MLTRLADLLVCVALGVDMVRYYNLLIQSLALNFNRRIVYSLLVLQGLESP